MKKYIAYYRKSTDTEDKQILSLKDQRRVVYEFAERKGLFIAKNLEFSESYSAKAPGRKVFNEVVGLLRDGKADGLVCYKADRLTRNYTDLGTLVQLIESDVEIWASDFGEYENNANGKMVFAFNALIAKLKIDHLSEDTKRGLEGRARSGWWPGWAPFGYMNVDSMGRITGKQYSPEKQRYLDGLKRAADPIEKDPHVSPYIKMAFESYAYQNFSLRSLCEKLNAEGVVARGGGKITIATLEQILKNHFYYGVMVWKGEIRDANHKPIISKSLFDLVQNRLSTKKPFQLNKKKNFLYKGLLTCVDCGCSITAEEKFKTSKNGNVHHYIYYHCTKSKGNCSQPYIEEKELEKKLADMFKGFFLSQEQADEIQEKLKELFAEDIDYQEKQEKALKTRLTKLKEEKKKILRKIATSELNDEETFIEIKNDIHKDIVTLKEKLNHIQQHSEDWLDQSSKLIYLAQHARELFLEGTKEEKQTLVRCVTSNLFLNDKNVEFSLNEPFQMLQKGQYEDNWLPLLDMFRNKEIELEISYKDIKTALKDTCFQLLF